MPRAKRAQPLKVAIVHDWLVGGGAERVVEELHRMFPEAPIYTSYCTDEWRKKLDGKVVTGWLQHFPRLRKYISFARAWWFSHLDWHGYDLVISSSGYEAKGIRVPEGTVHINYCHAPTHYTWSRYDEYMQHPGFGLFNPLARLGLKVMVGPMRRWDLKASKRPDYYIVNSTHTQAEIKKYYGRDSVVIWPPVEVNRFAGNFKAKRAGFVTVGRQTPYKRFDLAVAACTKLGLQLHVVGRGPDNARLRKLAGPTVHFHTSVTDAAMPKFMAEAEAFLFPGIDDFGITPIEAMACGTPVIAYHAAGALDYVLPDKTGLFFEEQTVDSLCKALSEFPTISFDHAKIQNSAKAFAPSVFRKRLTQFINQVMTK
jgi:glycosyltransferase involved in cell wall biosynthesis